MKPAPFAYHDPTTVEDALALLSAYGGHARVLAGGQSLLPLLKFRRLSPEALVDIRRIPGMDSIEAQESFVGSDFSYEDVSGRALDEFTYVLLDDNAAWKGPDGSPRPAYKLESTRRDRSAEFPRVISISVPRAEITIRG